MHQKLLLFSLLFSAPIIHSMEDPHKGYEIGDDEQLALAIQASLNEAQSPLNETEQPPLAIVFSREMQNNQFADNFVQTLESIPDSFLPKDNDEDDLFANIRSVNREKRKREEDKEITEAIKLSRTLAEEAEQREREERDLALAIELSLQRT